MVMAELGGKDRRQESAPDSHPGAAEPGPRWEQKIEILFKEYDTLRAEIISRTNNMCQLITIGAAWGVALLAWIGGHRPDRTFWISFSVFALVTS